MLIYQRVFSNQPLIEGVRTVQRDTHHAGPDVQQGSGRVLARFFANFGALFGGPKSAQKVPNMWEMRWQCVKTLYPW